MRGEMKDTTTGMLLDYIENDECAEFIAAVQNNQDLLNARYKNGRNIALTAAYFASLNILKYLHENHTDLLKKTSDDGLNILFLGAMSDDLDVFNFLIDKYPHLLTTQVNNKSILNYIAEEHDSCDSSDMFFHVTKSYPQLEGITRNFSKLYKKMVNESHGDIYTSTKKEYNLDDLLQDYIRTPEQQIKESILLKNSQILTKEDFTKDLENFSNNNGTVHSSNVSELKNLVLFICSHFKDEIDAYRMDDFHVWLGNMLLAKATSINLELRDTIIKELRCAFAHENPDLALNNALNNCFPITHNTTIQESKLIKALKEDADLINAVDHNGDNLAFKATYLGLLDLLDYLSKTYPHLLTAINYKQENIVLLGAMSGSINVFKYLVDMFPEQVWAKNSSGLNILQLVAKESMFEMFEYIADTYPRIIDNTPNYESLELDMRLTKEPMLLDNLDHPELTLSLFIETAKLLLNINRMESLNKLLNKHLESINKGEHSLLDSPIS